jgi:protein-disulfide isomerase
MRRILLTSVLAVWFAVGTAAAGPLVPVGPQDEVLGPADAPVTVVEYASLTCPHCGRWETEIFPQVRKDWIDTNKIRFVFRDFPLDGLALKAEQLAHCTGDQRFWGFLQAEFANQRVWAKPVGDPTEELIRIAKLGGLPETQARACMADDSPLAKLVTGSRALGEEAGVKATPTFFFNGKMVEGELSYDEFVKNLKEAGVVS